MYNIDSTTAPASPWLKPEQAANYAGLSINVLSRAAQRGEVASSKIGKARRFLIEDLDAWLNSNRRDVS
jgi:excisionase family DNA binding protein